MRKVLSVLVLLAVPTAPLAVYVATAGRPRGVSVRMPVTEAIEETAAAEGPTEDAADLEPRGTPAGPPPRRRAVLEETTSLSREAELGLKLFYDPILSANGKVSCSTCHIAARGYTSAGLPPALSGGRLNRRAPSLFNRGTGKAFFWDGRAKTLEDQALGPIVNPDEMGNRTVAPVLGRLRESPDYRRAFADVYPQWGVQDFTLARALAAFERELVTPPGPLDTYMSGRNELTLTPAESRGFGLFRGEARCYRCHPYPNLTDEGFHNTGIGFDPRRGFADTGRAAFTRNPADVGKFKTPGLRAVGSTGPYMHDASLRTLEDVVEFYDRGGVRNPNLDRDIFPLRLTGRQKADLVAFLKGL